MLYLNGTIADLYDGMLMKDMDRAVEILSEKIREEQKIRVIGDYDIDGVNATYILQEGLVRAGSGRGYGYSGPDSGWIRPEPASDRPGDIETGWIPIITCDNGIAAARGDCLRKETGVDCDGDRSSRGTVYRS